MAELPKATATIDETAGAIGAGTKFCTVIAPVSLNADGMPRVFASTKALIAQHGYCEGAEFCAHFFNDVKKPLIFCGVPIATPGAIGRQNGSGNSGTSVVSVAASSGAGPLAETDGVVKVVTGGTIGTSQIVLDLSLDGGRTFKRVKLGTANSYAIPYVNLTLSFGAGTLVAGETAYEWHTTAPRWDQAGLQLAREKLAAQLKQSRSWMLIGDLLVEDDATDVFTEANSYETANERDVCVRAQVRDRLPQAEMSRLTVRMTGSPTLTFATAGDTIERSDGSWIADGFAVGDTITPDGSADNDGDLTLTAVTATTLTVAENLVDEGPVGNVSVTGSPTITFAEVGETGDTIGRNRGSWLDDGFRVGDDFTINGSASNDITTTAGIVSVTDTLITLDSDDLVAETIRADAITITTGETMAAWVADVDAEFEDIDAQHRINLGLGRARKTSLITGYKMRRPAQWPACIRDYQHDVHIPTWRKADGPLDGWDLEDADGNTVEFDERIDGGALAGRFTCLRTYANGPRGTFVALDLTRAVDNSILSRQHNEYVANVACSVGRSAAEDVIGQVLQRKTDGSGQATAASIGRIKAHVDAQLKNALLTDAEGEGPRASGVEWNPDPTTDLSVPGTTWPAEITLTINGTIEKIATSVKVQ